MKTVYINLDFENPFLTIDDSKSLLLPLNLFISPQESTIDLIPAIRENVETLAGLDGDITYDVTYSPRLFDLQCYTPSNLTSGQKIIYKQHITYTLNQLKERAQPLLYQDKIYMVKLAGTMQPTSFVSWFNSSLQLKASDPFGYSQKVYTLKRNGVIRYNGNIKNGVIIEFKGPLSSPFVVINNHQISYSGDIPPNIILSVDTENQQAFLIDAEGLQTNATGNTTGIEIKTQLKASTTKLINDVIEFEPYKNIVSMGDTTNTTVKWREKFL